MEKEDISGEVLQQLRVGWALVLVAVGWLDHTLKLFRLVFEGLLILVSGVPRSLSGVSAETIFYWCHVFLFGLALLHFGAQIIVLSAIGASILC